MRGFTKIILFFLAGILALFFITKQCSSDKQQLDEAKEFKQDTTLMVIPVHLDITSFESLFNEQMDEQLWFYEENGVEVNRNLSISYRVKKQGRAQLFPEDETIQLRLPLFIDIRPKLSSSLSLGLGRNMNLQAKVNLRSAIAVDLNEDWELKADAQTEFEVQESPKLSVAGFEISFDEQLANSLEMGSEEINEQIEEQIKQAIDTRAIAELIWKELKEPYEIKSDEFDAWATIQPLSVQASDLTALGPGTLQTTFGIRSLIDVSTGTKPIFGNRKPLPDAERVNTISTEYSTFRFPLKIDFATFLNYLKEDEPYSFSVQGNRNFSLSGFRAENKEGNLIVTADFSSGPTKGELTLTGGPVFDERDQTIGVEIHSIESSSNNQVIDNLVNTMQKSAAMRKNIENRLSYSLSEDLADLTYHITNQLKNTRFNEYTSLNGYLNHMKIHNIYVMDNELWLDAEIEASTVCEVEAQQTTNE